MCETTAPISSPLIPLPARPRGVWSPPRRASEALLNDGGAWRSAWALQQLSATELDSRIALLEDAARAYRAERESRKTRLDALSKLNGDAQGIIFVQLCNVLDPGIAVALSSVSNELWTATQAPRQQLKTDHEAASVMCRKLGHGNRKALREAKAGFRCNEDLTADELELLGTLGSVLPALEELDLSMLRSARRKVGTDGVQRLAEKLGAGALPAVTMLDLYRMDVGDAGASALAAALGRGALPRLMRLSLYKAALGDAGLVALAPALQRLPALKDLKLARNPLGDEGLAALVAPPPPPAGAPPTTTGVLPKLSSLDLSDTQVADAGCAALASALGSGALPKLLSLRGTRASADARRAVWQASVDRRGSAWLGVLVR